MTVNIYADEMLVINFISNILITEITKKVLKERVGILRESITALFFSVVYTVLVISDLRKYVDFFTLLILNIMEIIVLFKPINISHFLKCFMAFKITAIFTNGCMFFLNNIMKNKFNYIILLFSFGITYISYVVLNLISKGSEYYSIDIVCSDKIINVNALVDTGNSLVEPISNKPVIVAEYSALKDVLPCKLVEIYDKKKESNLMEIISAVSEDNFRKSIRIIPFKSVGKEKGMMIGFVADSVKIKGNIINKPVIGICRFNLSKSGLYRALISPEHLGGL